MTKKEWLKEAKKIKEEYRGRAEKASLDVDDIAYDAQENAMPTEEWTEETLHIFGMGIEGIIMDAEKKVV